MSLHCFGTQNFYHKRVAKDFGLDSFTDCMIFDNCLSFRVRDIFCVKVCVCFYLFVCLL